MTLQVNRAGLGESRLGRADEKHSHRRSDTPQNKIRSRQGQSIIDTLRDKILIRTA
jgi:hypothetical protein